MKQQVPPKIFYTLIALVCLVVGIILYRQATDPIYHNEPDEEAARRQFSKPAAASAPGEPAKNTPASKPDASARAKSAPRPDASREPAQGKPTASSPGP